MTGDRVTTDASLAALIAASDAFERCPSCGRTVVQLSTHQCPSTDHPPPSTRKERERRAERDARSDDDRVGLYCRSNGNTYAYHELDDDGRPCCPSRNPSKASKFVVVSRREAKDRGRSPCGHCPAASGS